MASPAAGGYELPNSKVNPADLTHYERLGICPGATKDEITKAYHKQARKYHPDKSLDDKTEQWMKCINKAKEILLSEDRFDYDEKLAEEGHEFIHREPLGYLPEGEGMLDREHPTPLCYTVKREGLL